MNEDNIGTRTTEQTTAQLTTRGGSLDRPDFIRLPKPGSNCPRSGLSRSKMNELVLPTRANSHCPPVKSISLRRPGQRHATRLIDYQSLISYLRSFEIQGGGK